MLVNPGSVEEMSIYGLGDSVVNVPTKTSGMIETLYGVPQSMGGNRRDPRHTREGDMEGGGVLGRHVTTQRG